MTSKALSPGQASKAGCRDVYLKELVSLAIGDRAGWIARSTDGLLVRECFGMKETANLRVVLNAVGRMNF
jgi:hypothetical protein